MALVSMDGSQAPLIRTVALNEDVRISLDIGRIYKEEMSLCCSVQVLVVVAGCYSQWDERNMI